MRRYFYLILITILILPPIFSYGAIKRKYILLKNCPLRTTSNKNSIIFVGKVDDLGNDRNVKVFFEYGENQQNLKFKTTNYTLKKPEIFCLKVTNLSPCTTYYYRAVAQNSAGTNYGEIKSIKTKCK